MEVIQELLELLKNELFITWEDEKTNARLERIVKNAIPTMNYKLGTEIDYTKESQAQNLFLVYCVYAYNNCLKDFDENYRSEIYQIRMTYEVQGDEEQ